MGIVLPQCVASWLNGVENPAVIEAHLSALSDNLTCALEPQLTALIDDVAALIVRVAVLFHVPLPAAQ